MDVVTEERAHGRYELKHHAYCNREQRTECMGNAVLNSMDVVTEEKAHGRCELRHHACCNKGEGDRAGNQQESTSKQVISYCICKHESIAALMMHKIGQHQNIYGADLHICNEYV